MYKKYLYKPFVSLFILILFYGSLYAETNIVTHKHPSVILNPIPIITMDFKIDSTDYIFNTLNPIYPLEALNAGMGLDLSNSGLSDAKSNNINVKLCMKDRSGISLFKKSSNPELVIDNISVSNLVSSSATISWFTNEAASTQVYYRDQNSVSFLIAYDMRGTSYTGISHYAVLTDLNPNTGYYFKVRSGELIDSNNDSLYTFTTCDFSIGSNSHNLIGGIYMSDGNTPAKTSIVYIRVTNDTMQSLPLSNIVSDNGLWYTDFRNLRDQHCSSFIWGYGDIAEITIRSGIEASCLKQRNVIIENTFPYPQDSGVVTMPLTKLFKDADNDSFGDPIHYIYSCEEPEGYTEDNTDCNDNDPKTYPGARERCDGKDNDCDNALPDNETDTDQDDVLRCQDDCDDSDPNTYPGAIEICDGIDNDCNTILPAAEKDDDNDGLSECEGDCDDTDPNVNPNAMEICDSKDNNCNGDADEGFDVGLGCTAGTGACERGGYYVCTADGKGTECDAIPADPILEVCYDGIDNDCDGEPDNGCPDPNQSVLYTFHYGWNFLSLALMPDPPFTAATLAASINAQGGRVNKILKWDGSGWKTYLVGAPFGNFQIEIGKGYFVLCTRTSQWLNTGEKPKCINYSLYFGWNLLGFPMGGPYTAKSLAQDIIANGGNIYKVQKWDGSGWITYLVGAPFGNFDIYITKGYFIQSMTVSTFEICLF